MYRRGGKCVWTYILLVPQFAFAIQTVSTIKSDEVIQFFPTAAHLSESGEFWSATVHGCIFEPETGDILRNATTKSFMQGLSLDDNNLKGTIFEQRMRLFLVDNERGKVIKIRIANQEAVLEPSSPSGLFSGTVKLERAKVSSMAADGTGEFLAVLKLGDKRQFTGTMHFVDRQGVSVISDIDDTIKITEVRNKGKVFENTFLKPFQPVQGMAVKYQEWKKKGARFHYLSNGPWQLYQPISTFLISAGYPGGTVSLREFRVKDSSLITFLAADPQQAKLSRIELLIRNYPQRTFILVGDSGEKDPETYGEVARRFPKSVRQIFIRDVTDEPQESARYKQAFRDIPETLWTIFQDANSLPALE